mmetsp:Transcript_39923/g.58677  ORF Transcript_39923/g.58677 Transcript_39923/m.58677 type:complete len:218 (-) Transcript_39923:1673-2326(-)
MISLTKRFIAQFVPDFATSLGGGLVLFESERRFHGSFNVSTGESKAETGFGFAYKVQGHFWEALRLKICNNYTATETGMPDHFHDFSVAFVVQGKLEPGLRCVDTNDLGPGLPVQTVHLVFNDPRRVDGIIQSTNSTSITTGQAIFDVIQSSVNKHFTIGRIRNIPRTTLDPHSITNRAELLQLPVRNNDSVLQYKRHLASIWGPCHTLELGCIKLT